MSTQSIFYFIVHICQCFFVIFLGVLYKLYSHVQNIIIPRDLQKFFSCAEYSYIQQCFMLKRKNSIQNDEKGELFPMLLTLEQLSLRANNALNFVCTVILTVEFSTYRGY